MKSSITSARSPSSRVRSSASPRRSGSFASPDVLTRMHAATKPSVFGLLLVLLGVTLILRDPKVATMLTLAVLMQVLTAPVSGHLISRSAHRSGQWDAEHAVVDHLAEDEADGGHHALGVRAALS